MNEQLHDALMEWLWREGRVPSSLHSAGDAQTAKHETGKPAFTGM